MNWVLVFALVVIVFCLTASEREQAMGIFWLFLANGATASAATALVLKRSTAMRFLYGLLVGLFCGLVGWLLNRLEREPMHAADPTYSWER